MKYMRCFLHLPLNLLGNSTTQEAAFSSLYTKKRVKINQRTRKQLSKTHKDRRQLTRDINPIVPKLPIKGFAFWLTGFSRR
jgi:hypothetical protein